MLLGSSLTAIGVVAEMLETDAVSAVVSMVMLLAMMIDAFLYSSLLLPCTKFSISSLTRIFLPLIALPWLDRVLLAMKSGLHLGFTLLKLMDSTWDCLVCFVAPLVVGLVVVLDFSIELLLLGVICCVALVIVNIFKTC